MRFVPYRKAPLVRGVMAALARIGLAVDPERTWITIGRTIHHPDRADPTRETEIVAHELVHVRQWRRWGFWFGVAYLLLPLPIGLAWCRWRAEREAYLVQLRARPCEKEVERLVAVLWSAYAWPWPKPWMRRWFRKRLVGLRSSASDDRRGSPR